MDQLDRQNLAIMIDFGSGDFKIDGQPITENRGECLYFDPRLIVRGLEVVRGQQIGFARQRIEPLDRRSRNLRLDQVEFGCRRSGFHKFLQLFCNDAARRIRVRAGVQHNLHRHH